MNIVIAGGTGFVGKAIADDFAARGDRVYVLTRRPQPDRPGVTFIEWLTEGSHPESALASVSVDAVINVAGEPINKGRWTKRKKEAILTSRIRSVQQLIRMVDRLDKKPDVFVSASAVGYYGHARDTTLTERSSPLGNSFLSRVCEKWEEEAVKMEGLGVRTVIARIGVVLGKGGALSKMVLPYRFFVGGTLGAGEQWISWIHIRDFIGLIRFIIEKEAISGPVNFTAPRPVRMEELGRAIGSVLIRPHWLRVPEWLLKLVLGEMSSFLLEGQRVVPETALENGFAFTFQRIEDALRDVLQDGGPQAFR